MSEIIKPFTVVESPFNAPTVDGLVLNVRYAMLAVRDSMDRGELPYASHLFFTQMTDDNNPKERELGIDAGLTLCEQADQTAVYTDLGESSGMEYGIQRAQQAGRLVVRRSLFPKCRRDTEDLGELVQQASEEASLPSYEAIARMYGRIIK